MNQKSNSKKISFEDVMGTVEEPTLDEIIGTTNDPYFSDIMNAVIQEVVKCNDSVITSDILDDSLPDDLSEVMDDGTLRPCTEEEKKQFCYHR